MLPESHYLHSGYFGPVRRSWQSDGRDEVSKSQACAKINNFEIYVLYCKIFINNVIEEYFSRYQERT